jgi:rhomboid protease GluP
MAAAGLIAALVTAAMVANSVIKLRHEVDLRAMLIPNSQLPRTDAEIKSQVESLAARYPRDPRPRLLRGLAMLDAGDSAGAERELRAGLADAEIVKNLLPPRVEALLRANLAMALYGNSQKAEARTIAEPVCQLDTAESRPMRVPLKSIGVCN